MNLAWGVGGHRGWWMAVACGMVVVVAGCRSGVVRPVTDPPPAGLAILREGSMEYGLVSPPAPFPRGNIPLVVYLHGFTERPLVNQPWQVAGLQALEPCFVLIPTVPEDQGASAWGGTYDAELRPAMKTVLALIDKVVRERPVDAGRIYVYGGSMGGEGVFMLLAREPERFAGAVAVAGYTLEQSAAAMARTPLWILHGSNDTVNATDSSRKMYAAIQSAGGQRVRYTEYPGADHGTIWDLVRREPGLLAWLLAQRKPRIGQLRSFDP